MHDCVCWHAKALLQNLKVERRLMTIFEPSAQSWRINRWLDNGSPKNCGNKSNPYSHWNPQNPKADGHAFQIVAAWSALSLFCEPAAFGMTCRRSWAAAMAAPAGVDFEPGPMPVFGRRSGKTFSTRWDARDAWTSRLRSSTAPVFVLFLGGPHRAEPYGSGEERLQTPFDHRCPRHSIDIDHHARQRQRRPSGHPLVGFDSTDPPGCGSASFSSGHVSRRSRLRLGEQHSSHIAAWDCAAVGQATGRYARFGAWTNPLGRRERLVVVQPSSSIAIVLRAKRQEFLGVSPTRCSTDLSWKTGSWLNVTYTVLQWLLSSRPWPSGVW